MHLIRAKLIYLFCQIKLYSIKIELYRSKNERFKILYKNDQAYSRQDSKDLEMEKYSISEEDEKWSIPEFMDRLLNENYKDYIK